MILIADSSALITLSTVDCLYLLEDLFGQVYVPQSVFSEVTQSSKSQSKELKQYCFDKVAKIKTEINFNVSLRRGESEAIILYKEKDANFLLCDDKKARKFAKSFNINVIGSLGVLLKAKEKCFIENISKYIDILRKSDIFIEEKIYNLVLEIAGE